MIPIKWNRPQPGPRLSTVVTPRWLLSPHAPAQGVRTFDQDAMDGFCMNISDYSVGVDRGGGGRTAAVGVGVSRSSVISDAVATDGGSDTSEDAQGQGPEEDPEVARRRRVCRIRLLACGALTAFIAVAAVCVFTAALLVKRSLWFLVLVALEALPLCGCFNEIPPHPSVIVLWLSFAIMWNLIFLTDTVYPMLGFFVVYMCGLSCFDAFCS
jgi:hypothetical protein